MRRAFLKWTGFFGFTSVLLGAFAAHALSSIWSAERLAIFQTGVHYQIAHTLALFGVTLALGFPGDLSEKALIASSKAFIAGIFLFSGSLYLLTFTQVRALGMITPIGGILFMIGWIALALSARKGQSR